MPRFRVKTCLTAEGYMEAPTAADIEELLNEGIEYQRTQDPDGDIEMLDLEIISIEPEPA